MDPQGGNFVHWFYRVSNFDFFVKCSFSHAFSSKLCSLKLPSLQCSQTLHLLLICTILLLLTIRGQGKLLTLYSITELLLGRLQPRISILGSITRLSPTNFTLKLMQLWNYKLNLSIGSSNILSYLPLENCLLYLLKGMKTLLTENQSHFSHSIQRYNS